MSLSIPALASAIALAAGIAAVAVEVFRARKAKVRDAQREMAIKELASLADNIAHDLRTPLQHLAGMAEAAATDKAALESLPGNVADECASMLSLINTMLEISKTGLSIGGAPREAVDMKEIAKKTENLFRMVAAEKSVSFALFVPNGKVEFMGHRSKLTRLVGNLVDNAVKFTSRGGEVSLTVACALDGGVDIMVRDTGCGIKEADIPFIFNRFWRADSSRSRPGNGLGLALVKAIVDSYGGRIDVEATPRGGTTFKVHLPPPKEVLKP